MRVRAARHRLHVDLWRQPAGAAVPVDPALAARIKASSLPATAAASGGLKSGAKLEWTQLPQMRGRIVRIWTMHNPPRTVEILSADGAAIRVSPEEFLTVTRMGQGG